MPEMPEVRVVRDTLKKSLVGKRIEKISVLYPRIIEGNRNEFIKKLEGQTFRDVRSIGKWLVFDLGEYSFLSHLRMEGKYFYEDSDEQVEKHTHVVFYLDGNKSLRYNDVRKFGRMELVKTDEINEAESIKKLGLEPDNSNLASNYLIENFKSRNKPIKSVLLDQTIINGLGNIYANEVLFASRINPFREASSISKKEAEAIIKNAREITTKSYEEGGCTIRSYTSSLGVIGHYQDYLSVHGKEGCPCKICGALIKKAKIDGRSAYYCENCQK